MRLNPVLDREIKVKMRGKRAPILITVYLIVLTGIAALFFFAQEVQTRYQLYSSFNPRMMYNVFLVLLYFELVLILIITPALTAASISGEREKQTLDLLLCTKLSTFSIITGKLTASISQVILLLFASVPIFGLVFLYGGISVVDFILFMLFFIVTAMMIGSMGVFFSTFFRKSVFATVLTYIMVLIMTLGTTIGNLIFASIYYTTTKTEPTFWQVMMFQFCNPVVGFQSLLSSVTSPGSGSVYVRAGMSITGLIFGYSPNVFATIAPWIINIGFDILATAVFISLSALKLRPGKGS